MNAKDISYYLSLNYPVEILQIPENEGGGVSASIPLLGRLSCVGDGDTIQEAIDDLARVKRRVLEELIERGQQIPEPEDDDDSSYSGRILLRLPRALHKRVAKKAELRGESVNRYIVSALEADARARIEEVHDLIAKMQAELEMLLTRMTFAVGFGGFVMPAGAGEFARVSGRAAFGQTNLAGNVTTVPENAREIGRMVG